MQRVFCAADKKNKPAILWNAMFCIMADGYHIFRLPTLSPGASSSSTLLELPTALQV
jgi:hypothetical protein